MDLLNQINSELKRGFSKSELERLIGLPKNSLSGVLLKGKKLSKKSEMKVQRFMVSDKPNPLDLPPITRKSKKYDNVISEIDPTAGDIQVANKVLHDGVMAEIDRKGQNKTKYASKKQKLVVGSQKDKKANLEAKKGQIGMEDKYPGILPGESSIDYKIRMGV